MFEGVFKSKKPENSEEALVNQPGCCPACRNTVSMTTEEGHDLPKGVGNVVVCDHCAAELEIVEVEPLRFELLEEAK